MQSKKKGFKQPKQQSMQKEQSKQQTTNNQYKKQLKNKNTKKHASHSVVLDRPASDRPRVDEKREGLQQKLIMGYSASGPDVRNPRDSKADSRGDALQGQVGKVSTEYLLSDDAIRAICCASISHAQIAGWQASLDSTKQNYPFWAANYIYQVLYSAASGNAEGLPKVLPVWLRDVCAALFPKEDRRMPSGSASFKWIIKQNNNGIPATMNYPAAGVGQFFFGTDTNALTDGFPQMTPSPTGLPTDLQAAYTSLTNYFESSANLSKNEQNMWKLVSSILTESPLAQDVSAFAQSTPILGMAVGQNAFYDELRSILHVRCPKLSVFNGSKANSANDPALHVKVSAGDANYAVPSILMQDTTAGYYNGAVPKFKFIDFNEICDVTLRWLTSAMTYLYRNTTSHENLPVNCGMTMNQFQIMLRAMMIGLYPYQHAGQTIYPVDNVNNLNTAGRIFVPFLVTTATVNGISFPTTVLPLALVENLRALKLARDYQYFNPRTGKATMKHATYYVPVVGVYKDVVLDYKSYVYSDNNNNVVPILTGQGGNISLIDGNNGGTFINIADSQRLTELVTTFNEFVAIITPCTQSPTQLAFDDSVDALRVIAQDNLIDVKSNPNYKEGERDKWTAGYTYAKLGASYTKWGIARINQQKYLNALFAVQQQWILPEIPIYAGDPTTGYGIITIDKMRLLHTEAWYAPINKQPGLGVRLDVFRFGFISQLAKAYNAEDTTTVKVLNESELEGDGGLFSNIVKAFAPVAVSALRYGVTTVASSLLQ